MPAPPGSKNRGYRLPIAALLLLALIWGYAWVVMKIALRLRPAFHLLRPADVLRGHRALHSPASDAADPSGRRRFGPTALLGVLQTTGFVGLLTWALEGGGAGKTSILTYTMPFWLLLMAWVVLGERLKGFQWVAVGLALCGLDPGPGALAARGQAQRLPGGGRGALLGGERRVREDPTQASRGRPALADRVADAAGLHPAHRHRRTTWEGAPGMDRHLHRLAGLRGHPRQRGGLGPLALHPGFVPGGHCRAGHLLTPGDRHLVGLDPARRAAGSWRAWG